MRTWTVAAAVVVSVVGTGCTAAADACEGAELIADAGGPGSDAGDRQAQVERYEQLADGYDQIADDLGYERIGDLAEAARQLADSFAAGAANPLTDAAMQEDGGAAIGQLFVAEHPSGLPADIADDLDERCGTDLDQLPSGVTVTDGVVDDGAVDDGMVDGAVDDGMVDDGAGMDGVVDDGAVDDGVVDDGAGMDGEPATDG